MRQGRYSYHFDPVTACNMCGSPAAGHKILGRRLNHSQGRDPRKVVGISTTVRRCSTCDLVYSDPQPIPFDLQDHYGVPPEEYWKETYFTLDENYFVEELDRAKALLPGRAGIRALDVGAGIGKGMRAMAKAGFDTYGFEPSKPFHERAINRMGLDPERLKLGMIEAIEYPEGHFDLISFAVVLEHMYDPSAAILRAMRWLKPGGVMRIEVPSSNWLVNRLVNIYYRLRGTDLVANLSPMHEPYHLFEFAPLTFRSFAAKHGYQIAHQNFYVDKTFLPKVLDPLLVPYMKWTDQGMLLCVWLRKP
ncbi:MAG: class I SAM-dependent methyltransferase [Flavobacteriales bacterium]|nr:class I SAM-dependent methyltransferase [Flavobacteriales bacterium]